MVGKSPETYDPGRPHAFVCYSHSPGDRGTVYAELAALQAADVNLWYDEGMEPGSEWPQELATAISTCTRLLFFVSPASVASRNCRNEVQYARDHDKPIVAVYLEETRLPAALELTLATTHGLQRYALAPDSYRAQLVAALGGDVADPSELRATLLTPRRRERLLWLLGLVLAGGLAIALVGRAPTQHNATPTRFALDLPQGLDITPRTYFEMFDAPPLAISPDGRQIAFSAQDAAGEFQLYTRSLDQLDVRPLAGTQGGTAPFFSADGQWLGFVAERALMKIRLQGGDPQTIVPTLADSGFGGAHWGPDDTIIYSASSVSGLYTVSALGGDPVSLSEPEPLDGELALVMPQVLPDANAILLSVRMGLAPDAPRVALLDRATGERRTLVEGGIGARYVNGRLIYSGTGADTGSLWSMPFDLDARSATGEPQRVLEAMAADLYALGYYSLSDSGSLIYIPPAPTPRDDLFWVDGERALQPIVDSSDNMMMPAIAPDGQRIALSQIDDARELNLWLLDPARGSMVQLATGGHNSHSAVWTPDGERLVFTSDHDGPSNLYIKEVDSGSPPRRLTVSEQHHDAASFSPDGAILTYAEMHPITNWDLWFYDLRSGESRPFLNTEAEEIQAIVSPRGGHLVYTSNETGRREIYLERFPGGGGKQRVSQAGGEDPVWSADGQTVYYRWENRIYSASIVAASRLTVGEPAVVFEGVFEGRAGYGKPNWDVSTDGRFLLTSRQTQSLEPRINVILNWLERD